MEFSFLYAGFQYGTQLRGTMETSWWKKQREGDSESKCSLLDSHWSTLWSGWSGLVPGLVTTCLIWFLEAMWHPLINPGPSQYLGFWSTCEFLGLLLTARDCMVGALLQACLSCHFSATLLSPCPGHGDCGFVLGSTKRLTCSFGLCFGKTTTRPHSKCSQVPSIPT